MKRKIESDECILVVGEARISASKTLLKAKSPVFEAMFESGMNEDSSNELKIVDFSEDVVKSFVLCLGKNTAKSFASIGKHPRELLAIANKYQIVSLVLSTQNHICSSMTVSNVVSLLVFADLHNNNVIKNSAFELISKNISYFPNLSEGIGPELSNEFFTFMSSRMVKKKPSTTREFCTDLTMIPTNTRVIVSGASIIEVNGIYNCIGIVYGAGFYTKNCVFNNDYSRMTIYKSAFESGGIGWFISNGACDDEVSSTVEDDLLYCGEETNDIIENTLPSNDLRWTGNADLRNDNSDLEFNLLFSIRAFRDL
jgi:hypothetical protein